MGNGITEYQAENSPTKCGFGAIDRAAEKNSCQLLRMTSPDLHKIPAGDRTDSDNSDGHWGTVKAAAGRNMWGRHGTIAAWSE